MPMVLLPVIEERVFQALRAPFVNRQVMAISAWLFSRANEAKIVQKVQPCQFLVSQAFVYPLAHKDPHLVFTKRNKVLSAKRLVWKRKCTDESKTLKELFPRDQLFSLIMLLVSTTSYRYILL